MRPLRWILAAGLLLLLAGGLYFAARSLDLVNGSVGAVRPLGADEQEIAYIEPATNVEDWERLVTALTHLRDDWPSLFPGRPALHVDLERAFPPLTADVPEVALTFDGVSGQTLWVRWYKVSGGADARARVEQLRRRGRPPIAVLGGGTSGRAIRLALALNEAVTQGWNGTPPIFLMTTATAEIARRAGGKKLIELYPGRTFRFAFTNGTMVETVLRFVRQQPQVWLHRAADPAALAGAAALGDAWAGLGVLLAAGELTPPSLYTVHWEDDSYSRDLADAFRSEFRRRFPGAEPHDRGGLPYSVGDFYHPNPAEQAAVGTLVADYAPFPPHSLLVLPTGAQRMRRFLGNLRSRAPLEARHLVVVNGDAISFTTVYRDRDYAWNIQDLPFNLIFFTHRDPVDPAAGFSWTGGPGGRSRTGTTELLLYRDIFEAMLHAAFADGRFLEDADAVRGRLRRSVWVPGPDAPAGAVEAGDRVYNALEMPSGATGARELFDAEGNRRRFTGEHVVWLRPSYSGDRLDLVSTISVWEVEPPDHISGRPCGWRLRGTHAATYNQSRPEED